MKKTILVESFQQKELLSYLLTQQDIILKTEFLSLSSYLEKRATSQSPTTQLIKAHQILSASSNDMEILSPMLQYCETSEQLLSFAIECVWLNISIDDLPCESAKDRDIKLCLQRLQPILHSQKEQFTSIHHLKDASSLSIVSSSLSFVESKIMAALIEKGASIHKLPILNSSHQQLFHAQNPRQEMEACFQHILTNHYNDAVIILSDYDHQIEALKAIALRYDTPLNLCKESPYNPAVNTFRHLLTFLNEPTFEHLKNVVLNNSFKLSYPDAWMAYFERFCEDTYPLHDSIEPFNIEATQFDQRLKQDYHKQQEQALLSHQEILSILDYFPSTLEEKLIKAYELTQHAHPDSQSLPLRDYLSNHLQELLYDPTSAISICLYQTQSLTSKPIHQHGIRVVDLNHLPLLPVKNLYLLQTNQAHFPNYSTQSGLIDESYLEQIKHYPSLQERLLYQKEQRDAIHRLGKNIIYSYYDGNYEGKSSDVAFEIDSLIHQKQRWPLIHHEQDLTRTHGVDSSTSQALFLKNNKISGSISRFELFIKSPYSFFLKYGLKVYEPSSFSLEDSLVGQVRHKLLEQLVKEKGSLYASPTSAELNLLINQSFEDIETLLPLKRKQLMLVKQRMYHSLSETLAFLKVSDEVSNYQVYDSEIPFKHIDLPSEQGKISLSGVIDRLDRNQHSFRIIDYKSSDHDLSETQVKKGYQLQLCTYALIAERLFDEPVAGVYYINLRIPTIQIDYASYGIRQGLSFSKPLTLEDIYESYRLKGWTFLDPSHDYHSARYIKGFKEKNEQIQAQLYDLEAIKTLLGTIYSDIEKQILMGTIDLDPRHSEFIFEYQHFKTSEDYQYEGKTIYLEDLSLKVKS